MTKDNYVSMTGPGRLELKRMLPSTPERVWAYLVEDELRRKWFCGGDVEPRVGGVIVFDFDHSRFAQSPPPEHYADLCTIRMQGEVLVYDKPHRLVFSWPEDDGETSSKVTITLTAIPAGVELHLIHEPLHQSDSRTSVAAGWHTHFDLLEDILNNRPLRDFWLRHAQLEAEYQKRYR